MSVCNGTYAGIRVQHCTLTVWVCFVTSVVATPPAESNAVPPSIGLDLGTTTSWYVAAVIARWTPYYLAGYLPISFGCSVGAMQDGGIKIIPNGQGNRVTPAFISWNVQAPLVGAASMNHNSVHPGSTIFDMKRMIGRAFNDSVIQEGMMRWPFDVVNLNGKPVIRVVVGGENKTFDPEELSAMLASYHIKHAEHHLGVNITRGVITVPIHFSQSQREATIVC
jgi:molecular chaperone DnaK (HSP70)